MLLSLPHVCWILVLEFFGPVVMAGPCPWCRENKHQVPVGGRRSYLGIVMDTCIQHLSSDGIVLSITISSRAFFTDGLFYSLRSRPLLLGWGSFQLSLRVAVATSAHVDSELFIWLAVVVRSDSYTSMVSNKGIAAPGRSSILEDAGNSSYIIRASVYP